MYPRKTLFLILLAIPSQLVASKKARAFIAAHKLPDDIIEAADRVFSSKEVYRALKKCRKKTLREAGIHLIQAGDNIIMEHPDVPGYIMKWGNRFHGLYSTIRRIRMAEKIDNYLKREKITTVHVPHKWLYHLPGRGKKLRDRNYLVFSEKMPVQPKKSPRHLSHQAMKDTCKVIRRFAIVDASPGNMGILDEDNVAILDTEPTIRTGGGLWYVFDNPLSRLVQAKVGTWLFRRSLQDK